METHTHTPSTSTRAEENHDNQLRRIDDERVVLCGIGRMLCSGLTPEEFSDFDAACQHLAEDKAFARSIHTSPELLAELGLLAKRSRALSTQDEWCYLGLGLLVGFVTKTATGNFGNCSRDVEISLQGRFGNAPTA